VIEADAAELTCEVAPWPGKMGRDLSSQRSEVGTERNSLLAVRVSA